MFNILETLFCIFWEVTIAIYSWGYPLVASGCRPGVAFMGVWEAKPHRLRYGAPITMVSYI